MKHEIEIKLQAWLDGELPDREAVEVKRLLAADPEGRLEFEHGWGPKVDLCIGADGVFSRVRDSLKLGTRIVDLKDGCGRHLIPRKPEDSINVQRIEMWNGGRRVGIPSWP